MFSVINVSVVLVRKNQEYKCQEVVLAIANFITPEKILLVITLFRTKLLIENLIHRAVYPVRER